MRGAFLFFVLLFSAMVRAERTHEFAGDLHSGRSTAVPNCLPIPLGNEAVIPDSSDYRVHTFSSDGTFVLLTGRGKPPKVYDLRRNRYRFELPDPSDDDVIQMSSYGNVLVRKNGATVRTYDIKTGQELTPTRDDAIENFNGVRIAPNGGTLALWNSNTLQVYRLGVNGFVLRKTIPAPSITDVTFAPGSDLLAYRTNRDVHILNAETGDEIITDDNSSKIGFSRYDNYKFFSITADGSTLRTYDLNKGKFDKDVPISNVDLYGAVGGHGYARYRLANYVNGTVGYLDADKPRLHTTTISGEVIAMFPGTPKIVAKTDGQTTVYNAETSQPIVRLPAKLSSKTFSLSPDGNSILLQSSPTTTRDDGPITVFKIENGQSSCGSYNLTIDNTDGVNRREIDALKNSRACREPIKDHLSVWQATVPNQANASLTATEAMKALVRFQKMEGMNLTEDLPILLAVLDWRELATENISLVDGALEGVLYQSTALYDAILAKYPWLLDVPRAVNQPPACRSEDEQTYFTRSAGAKASNLLSANNRARGYTTLPTWKPLSPLRGSLAKLPQERKDEYLHDIVLSMANHALQQPNFVGMFPSKIHNFALSAVSPMFGIEPRVLTDIDVRQDREHLRPRILGTHPIDGTERTKTDYGIYVKPLSSEHVGERAERAGPFRYRWRHHGHEYTANVEGTRGSETALVRTDTSYPYEEFWKDNKLTGTIIIGANMEGDYVSLPDEFLRYYRDRGYQFDHNKRHTVNTVDKLKEMVESGEVDYIWKEAHSGGADRELVTVWPESQILTGRKQLPNGKEEVMHLLYPVANSNTGAIGISNQDFGNWMKERDRNQRGSLTYFNASCFSADGKAANEILAAGTPKLIEIATEGLSDNFTIGSESASYHMLNGLLDQKTYEETRREMAKDPYYVANEYDHYLFPDERRYQQLITDRLTNGRTTRALDISVHITDENGNAHSITR